MFENVHSIASLQAGNVRIWTIDLGNAGWDACGPYLSTDERQRLARYRGALFQSRFRRCRGALRAILACHIGQSPSSLAFQYGEYGKPALLDVPGLHFNLSHSGDRALLAMSAQPIGIDIERIDQEKIDLRGLIDMVCHPSEHRMLAKCTTSEKLNLFYQLWTQKEAYCKMLGQGLHRSLSALHFVKTVSSALQVHVENSIDSPISFVYPLHLSLGYAASFSSPISQTHIEWVEALPGHVLPKCVSIRM